MANRITDGPRVSPLRLVVFLGLAAGVLTGAFALPAQAASTAATGNSEARQAPASYQLFAQNRYRERGPVREGYRDGYYRGGPSYYYTAPPVIYVPPRYYQEPAPLFDLTIPLVIR